MVKYSASTIRDEASAQKSDLPMKKLIPIYITLWAEAFNSSSIFAYAGYMILDLGASKSKDDPSYRYYAGLLASSFFLTQFFSSFVWGWLSDKFGRRPILLIGAFGSLLSTIAFGFSWNIAFALFSRSLNGLLNGTVGVSKTYLGEICDSKSIVRAFGGISLTWGFGSITGSMLGGLLAQPASKYPSIFPVSSIFGKFPYLLPNLICAIAILVGFVLIFFCLPENPKATIVRSESTDDEIFFQENNLTEGVPGIDTPEPFQPLDSNYFETMKTRSLADLEYGDFQSLDDPETQEKTGCFTKQKQKLLELYKNLTSSPILQNRMALLACVCYGLLGMVGTMFDDVFPLFAMSSRESGGLDFGTDEIGIVNAFGGAITLPIQLLLYPSVVSSFSLLSSFKFGMLISIPLYPLFPLMNSIKHPYSVKEYIYFWSVLCLLQFIRQVSMQFCFSGIMTAVSNSVVPEQMGVINGISQSMVSLTRTVAPITGAMILELSIRGKKPFPFNFHIVWYVLAILAAITFVLSLKLPSSYNLPKLEAMRQQEMEKNSVAMEEVSVDTREEVVSN